VAPHRSALTARISVNVSSCSIISASAATRETGSATAYWLNLLIDTTLPICGNAAQRPQGQLSNDGPLKILCKDRVSA
jgi:hypothetical protein